MGREGSGRNAKVWMVLVPLIGGLSPWLVSPIAENIARGRDLLVADMTIALVPLVSALIAVAYATSKIGSRGPGPLVALLPFVVTTATFAVCIVAADFVPDLVFAFCLFAMPLFGLVGGVGAFQVANRRVV